MLINLKVDGRLEFGYWFYNDWIFISEIKM